MPMQKIPFDMEYIDLTKPRPEWLMQANAGKVGVHAGFSMLRRIARAGRAWIRWASSAFCIGSRDVMGCPACCCAMRQVPVIKEKDTMLPDSDKIVVMLEERFPQPSMKSSAPEGM